MTLRAGTVTPVETSFLWEIKNFSNTCKNIGDFVSSPEFSTNDSSIQVFNKSTDHKWNLCAYPKGHKNSGPDYVSLFLKYMGQNNVEVYVTLSLLDDKYSKVHEMKFQKMFERGSAGCGFPTFIEQNFLTDNMNRVLVNDTINILCEIIYNLDIAIPLKSERVKEKEQDNLPDYCRLKEFDEFEKLWETKSSTDVIVKIGDYEIKVHKLIIMTRSPVFQAMFEHDMKEKEQNVVEITDIKYEVMNEALRFMYVGKVYELEKIAGDLLFAAEKYSLNGLKIMCEKEILKNLSVANAVEYLKLADMCNAVNLKSEIIKLIVRNQKDIIHTPEFKLLPVEIECEVLRAIVAIDINK